MRATPGLTLKPVYPPGPFWLYFPEQWDPKSPWHDERVRRAANLAIDRKSINEALTLGYSKLTNSIIPDTFDFAWKAPEPVFDRGEGEAAAGRGGASERLRRRRIFLRRVVGEPRRGGGRQSAGGRHPRQAAPARTRGVLRGVRQQEAQERRAGRRAAPSATPRPGSRPSSSRAAPIVYGSYPDIDELFQKQATELDPKRRDAILHKMQQLVHEKAIYAPIWQLAFMNAYGPRVGESGFGLIPAFAYTGPYEDITIKGG